MRSSLSGGTSSFAGLYRWGGSGLSYSPAELYKGGGVKPPEHRGAQLSHGTDDVVGQALDVNSTVLSLLPNEVCV